MDVDKVAQAICQVSYSGSERSWEHPAVRSHYRRLAEAAIGAMGLRMESESRGDPDLVVDCPLEGHVGCVGGAEYVRFVSPWVRKG